MDKGGKKSLGKVDQATRYASLLIPALLMVYGLMIEYGVMPNNHYMGFGALIGLTIPGITLAVFIFLFWTRDRSSIITYLILFHTYAIGYALLISGFNSPFSVAWVLLQLVTFYYLGQIAFRISILAFFMTAIADAYILIFLGSTLANAFGALLAGLTMVIVSSTIVQIARRSTGSSSSEIIALNQAHQQDRLLTIVNNMADSFFTVNYDGKIELYNAAALDLLDTNRTLTGVGIQEVLRLNSDSGQSIDIIELLHESRGLTIRDNIALVDEDEKRWIELTYSPVQSNNSQADSHRNATDYIVLMRDITKEKSLSEERDEFISVVSHELRTPITVSEGTLSNLKLLANKKDVDKKIFKHNIDQAYDQILFLARMVNDLSTLSRAERGVGNETEHIEVRALVNELYNEYLPQAEKHSLTLDLDLSAHLGHVETSRLYLKELLQNFLSNSLKYTQKGGLVLHVKRKEKTIEFMVSDSGIGISKSDQKKIFERFYRSEDYRTRETGGTGLGLYVANKLANKMGTHIVLKSRLNYGSKFSFELQLPDKT